jgi:electron transport complex protein RnfD
MRTGPHMHLGVTSSDLFWEAQLALLPLCVGALWRYGFPALHLLLAGILTAWATAYLLEHLAGKDLPREEGAAPLTGLLLALMLPVQAPWWMAGLGGSLSILGRDAFGGTGRNPVNPAVLGRLLLTLLFPGILLAPLWELDGVSQASPLAKGLGASSTPVTTLLWGGHPGTLAEACPLLLLLGGLFLMLRGRIDRGVPLHFLSGLAWMSLLLPPGPRLLGHSPWLAGNSLVQVLGGGSLLAAFFLLTDPVTSPVTPGGRRAYALLAAAGTLLVRYWTPFPDGVLFAILLANLATPLMDQISLAPGPGRLPSRDQKAT